MDETNDLSISLGLDPSDLRSGLSDAERIIETSAQRIRASIERIGNLGQQLAGLGATMTASLTLPIIGLATASIKAYGDIEALKKGLEAVAGSAELAERQFKDMKEVAKLPGLGLQEAVKGTINLQAIGFSASKAKETLLQFGNAVATVGKGRVEFERAIYGISQLANTPFPLGEDLNIVADVLPQVRTLLNETFGTSRTEELRALGVSSQELVDTIIKGLGKLPRVSGGVKNAFENMGDSIQQSLGRIGEVINKNFDIASIVEKLSGYIDRIVSGFESLDPAIQKAILVFAGLTAVAGPLLVAVGGFMALLPTLTAGVTALGTAFLAILSPIGLVTIALLGVVTAVVANWDKIRPYLDDTIDKFKRLYKESAIVRAGITILGASIEGFARSGLVVLDIFYKNFVDFGKGVLNIFKGIGDGIEGVLTFDVKKIAQGFAGVMSAPLGFINDLTKNSISGLKRIGEISFDVIDKWSTLDFSKLSIPNFSKKVEDDVVNGVVNGIAKAGAKIKVEAPEIEALTPFKFSSGFDGDKEYNRVLKEQIDSYLRLNDLHNQHVAGISDLGQRLKREVKIVSEAQIELDTLTGNLNQSLNNLVSSSISGALSDMFSSIGTAIGQGTSVVGAIGQSLIKSFGSFLSDLGKMLIEYGTLAVTKGSLDIVIQTGGYQAIVAGLAAIAVGAALSIAGSAIGSRANTGMNGSVSSSTGASSGNNYSGSYTSGGGFGGGEIILRASGPDLIAVINRNVLEQDRLTAG